MAKIEEKDKAQLFVEGNDDQHVIWALCKKFKIAETFDVIDCGSYEKLLKKARYSLKLSSDDISILGIIVDADTDLENRTKELLKVLDDVGYETEKLIVTASGLIIDASTDLPRLGVWIMPDNSGQGALEHFIEKLIPPEDKLHLYAEKSLTEMETDGVNLYNAQNKNHRQKALISTWLAWQKDPGTPMGLAITKSYLTINSDLCQRFITWLNDLFNTNHSDTHSTFIQ